MTETEVRSRSKSGAAVIWFLLGAVFLVPGVFLLNPHWAVCSVLPFFLAAASWLSHEPEVVFEVTEEGLSFLTPDHVFVRYADIQGLTAQGQASGSTFPMQVYHPEGVVRIPATLNVSSQELYRFLLMRLPRPSGVDSDHLPSALRSFVAEQLELFGHEKVFVFGARPFPPATSHGGQVAYSRAVALTGAVWIVLGVVLLSLLNKPAGRDDSGMAWVVCGFIALIFGVLFAVISARQSTSNRVANWQDSWLVLSPGGIALTQGDLRGKMRWDELRSVEFPAKPRWGLTSSGGAARGIGLMVDGAYLVIADYYDRPLGMIHSRIKSYWGGREAN